MANQEQVERLLHSVEEWNQWREQYPDILPDLSHADLYHASLSHTNLKNANLSHANLSDTNLSWVDLSGASLSGANLYGASLNGTDLSYVNLSFADLSRTNLSGVYLRGTKFNQAIFFQTVFAWVDLSPVQGLQMARHDGPSNVDIRLVTLPHDEPTRLHFLRGVGFTETQIEYLPSLLTPRPIEYASLFISYAHQDEAIAQRLYTDLRKKNVLCWMAPHDLRPGDYHHSRIDEAIHLHEKTLLLLSEHAVNSSWVKHEVQIALAREIAQDCTVLYPLRLDETVMRTNKDWAVRLRDSRHIGDFTKWQDEAAYQQAFTTLLRHLKVSKP